MPALLPGAPRPWRCAPGLTWLALSHAQLSHQAAAILAGELPALRVLKAPSLRGVKATAAMWAALLAGATGALALRVLDVAWMTA
jgi:hypothetical protein